jgi:peptide/nickel transport system substrate-binding protein
MKSGVAALRAVLLAVALGLSAMGSADVRSAEPVLRIGMSTEPNSLSPLFALSDYEEAVDRLIFDVLVSVSDDGHSFVPRLAAIVPTLANGGIARDGRTITYHLRRNVRWHDGAPFTSSDVAFSYRAIMNPANNVPNRHGYDEIAGVSTPDAYTVVFRMKRTYAPAITTLFSDAAPNPILPAHLLARYPDLNRVDFNTHPVGTGPYRFMRWDHGSAIELSANDDYYLGAPKIARVSVRIVPDETTMVNQLRTHELDMMLEGSVTAYGQLRTVPSVRVHLTRTHAATNLLINQTRSDLTDVRVRRAIAAAIDKAAIVRDVTFGAATVATQDLPSFLWAYDARAVGETYDPAHARALLASAGWRAGADGIAARGGHRLSFVLAFAQNNASGRVIAVQLQSYLRVVGIEVQLKGYASSLMFAPYSAGGIYQSGRFDLALYTMTLGIDPDASGRFTSGAIPPNGQNYSRYESPAMDAAQADGIASFDRSVRSRAYARSQELLARDVPIVFIYWPDNIDACDARLLGFSPNPKTSTWNAYAWSY